MSIRSTWRLVVITVLVALYPAAALAQAPPPARPIQQTAEFATVRAKFEGMTEAQVRAMGYTQIEPVCVDAASAGLPAALGAMGFHILNPQLFGAQFPTGRLDPQYPPILLLDANRKVVGLEWEAKNTGQSIAPLFGQQVPLLPGHPGPPDVNVPHHMLHAYFKPNGMVLFNVWDPDLKCPAAAPAALPRTGGVPLGLAFLAASGLLASGLALRPSLDRPSPAAGPLP